MLEINFRCDKEQNHFSFLTKGCVIRNFECILAAGKDKKRQNLQVYLLICPMSMHHYLISLLGLGQVPLGQNKYRGTMKRVGVKPHSCLGPTLCSVGNFHMLRYQVEELRVALMLSDSFYEVEEKYIDVELSFAKISWSDVSTQIVS